MDTEKTEIPNQTTPSENTRSDNGTAVVYTYTRSVDRGIFFKNVRRIRQKKFRNHGRIIGKDEKISLKSLKDLKISKQSDPRVNVILGLIDEELTRHGLLSDEGQEVAFSEVFPISQSKDDKKTYFKAHAEDIEDRLSFVTKEGNELGEVNQHGLIELPLLATPQMHNLMRGGPIDIFEKIARLMVESNYFGNNPENISLRPCAYFLSKRANNTVVFSAIRNDLATRGLNQFLKDGFDYDVYQKEIPELKILIESALKDYFCTPWVRAATTEYLSSQGEFSKEQLQTHLDSFWKRYDQAWESLTTKQKNVLNEVYLFEETLSWEEAAKKIKISVDSFQDRIRGAVNKFKKAFPELFFLKEALNYRDIHKRNNLQRGLFDQTQANTVEKLYRIDPATNKKTEIAPRSGEPLLRKGLNLAFKEEIKALAQTNAPVPDILDCDFFGGLYPEVYFERRKGEAAFVGGGLANQKLLKKLREGHR